MRIPRLNGLAARLWSARTGIVWLAMSIAGAAEIGSPGGVQPAQRLRVMTYNIHHGEGLDGKLDLDRIAALIRDAKADLVALQEVDRGVRRTDGRDLAGELADRTGMTAVFAKNIDYQGGEYGNAILSRHPVLSVTNLHYRMLRDGEQRGLLQTEIELGGARLIFMCTHLDFRPDDRERVSNVGELIRASERFGPGPQIVCGDFNATPDSPTHAAMEARFVDGWSVSGDGEGFTVPSEAPRRRIDFVWVRPANRLRPIRSWAPASKASDHLPVVTEFEWMAASP